MTSEGLVQAYGLGLMLFSPAVLADMPEGADFMAALGADPKGRAV